MAASDRDVNQFVTWKSSICKDSAYHQKKCGLIFVSCATCHQFVQNVQIAKVQNANNVCLQIVQEFATCQYLSLIAFKNFEVMSDLLTEVTLEKFTS